MSGTIVVGRQILGPDMLLASARVCIGQAFGHLAFGFVELVASRLCQHFLDTKSAAVFLLVGQQRHLPLRNANPCALRFVISRRFPGRCKGEHIAAARVASVAAQLGNRLSLCCLASLRNGGACKAKRAIVVSIAFPGDVAGLVVSGAAVSVPMSIHWDCGKPLA